MSSLNVAALSSVNIQKIKKEELTDIRSIKLDPSVPQDLRAVYVLKEMGNPSLRQAPAGRRAGRGARLNSGAIYAGKVIDRQPKYC